MPIDWSHIMNLTPKGDARVRTATYDLITMRSVFVLIERRGEAS